MTRSQPRCEDGMVTSEYAVGTYASVSAGVTILLVAPHMFDSLWAALLQASHQILGGLS